MKWYDSTNRHWVWNRNKQECEKKTAPVKMGAEYRFVPVFPRVAPAPVQLNDKEYPLSHARPVPGGFSGRLEFDLIAETPVLFGRQEKIEGKEVTTNARLFEGGPFVAPGRAIKGLLRNVFGIITASHFKPINGDHRFSSRNMDYLGVFAKDRHDPGNEMKIGWLRPILREGKIEWKIFLFDKSKLKKVNSAIVAGSLSYERDFKKHFEEGSPQRNPQTEQKREACRKGILHACAIRRKKKLIQEGKIGRGRQAIKHAQRYIENHPELIHESWDLRTFCWISLPIEKRHEAMANLPDKIGPIKIKGEGRQAYLVTAGKMQTRENEALFPLPLDKDWEPVNETAIASFLFNNSKYAKEGAEYPVGGKRTPDGNFRLFLAEYLFGLGEAEGKKIAKALGMTWEDVENTARRRDNAARHSRVLLGRPRRGNL